ncbi:PqqD family protein [Streptomyces sp. NPDC003077]|uniref:PqqD family protein n=1 Tax=Streptomyces sp. NPDC003077 TaxID=3154443 RepID=UPI0033A109D0
MLTPAPSVHYATGPHGTAVLDVRRARWLMLDEDASRIWHAVAARGSTAGLAEEIAVQTGQDPRAVSGRITAFVDELVAAGVLLDTDRLQKARKRWWRR